MYIVAIIENGSDYPGIAAAYGPYDADETALVVKKIEDATGFKRGNEIQVSMCLGFTSDTFKPEELY